MKPDSMRNDSQTLPVRDAERYSGVALRHCCLTISILFHRFMAENKLIDQEKSIDNVSLFKVLHEDEDGKVLSVHPFNDD
jgi:hypothetical protein